MMKITLVLLALLGQLIIDCEGWVSVKKSVFGFSPNSDYTRLCSSASSDVSSVAGTPVANGLIQNDDGSYGWTDQEFQEWILEEMITDAPNLYQNYTQVFHDAAVCMTKWRQRYRGDSTLWKRLFKRDRVVKEVIESVPIIAAVNAWVRQQALQNRQQNITIIDLCSGKGYLSMILSECLPDDMIQKCVLVDKAWPMCYAEPKPHHISWDHIYGNISKGTDYFSSWPIPLHTSKQDMKQAATIRQFEKRFTEGPILILGVHLCGTLSIQAVKLFHQLPEASMMVLKPCCLPGMVHARRNEYFEVGQYSFPTKDVCAPGRFRGKQWEGPPRWQLEGKFTKWCRYLLEALQENDQTMMCHLEEIEVQTKGGYQNTFLFAEKAPIVDTAWWDLKSM